ncbi:MAG: hypothetical protein V1921_07055 [Candidatus Altiarchaeota archaeon]
MRNTLVYVALMVLVGGCLTGESCRYETINVTSTELTVDMVPRNQTRMAGDWEPYVKKDVIAYPLSHEIVEHTAGNTKWPVKDEYSEHFDYRNFDQNITANIRAKVRNTDNITGNFTVIATIDFDDGSSSINRTVELDAGETKEVLFEFNISREQDWEYTLKVTPDVREVEVYNLDKVMSDKPTTYVDYDYVKKVTDVIKNHTIRRCD